MRLGMILMWALALVSSVLVGSVECYQQNRENRDKPRATRGFKPLELSTARGFGKRGANSDFIAPSEPSQYLDRDSFPADWFVDELQNNGELARLIVNKFIDTNQDGELTADELLRPIYLNDKSASMYK